jgi:Tfp pilus assembly ATPase PilU
MLQFYFLSILTNACAGLILSADYLSSHSRPYASFGEKVVIRILDSANAGIPLDALGFSPPELVKLEEIINRPQGIILVTGPTGSGKTTTLRVVAGNDENARDLAIDLRLNDGRVARAQRDKGVITLKRRRRNWDR